MKYYLDIKNNDILDYKTIIQNYNIDGVIKQDGEKLKIGKIKVNDQIDITSYINFEEINIKNSDDMKHALEKKLKPDLDAILIKTTDWHIIPIENLIAKLANERIDLIAVAKSPDEVSLLNNILELGVDGIVLQEDENYSFEALLQAQMRDETIIKLEKLEVESIERMGNGDRVCVDTCSILEKGEGLLVGSTSGVLALVEAEVEETGFVNARPFRINAGVVASYALNFDKTNYLSELEAGSSVMITNQKGQVRKEKVARVKIEKRPLVLIKVYYNNRTYPIILQDAETVKIITPEGSIRVTEIKPGQKILCYVSDKARHFGMEIDEFLEER